MSERRINKELLSQALDVVRLSGECEECGSRGVRVHRFECRYVCTPCVFDVLRIRDKQTIGGAVKWAYDKGVCAYCGEYALEIEHVIPRAIGMPTWTVMSCQECNSLANAFPAACFTDKRDHIRAKLRKKYARVLRMPEWDDSEIEELGPGLRSYVKAHHDARRVVSERISFTLEAQYSLES